MGDIADMILDGVLCDMCGAYIGDPVEHPVTCKACRVEDEDTDAGVVDYD